MKRYYFIKSGLLSLVALCSMALTIGSCANDDVAQNPTIPNDDKNLTTFVAGTPTTRTSMESDGKFFWEAGDKIYVKDDNNTWHASSNSPTGKTDNFKFRVPGTYAGHTSYEVYYPGQGGSNDQVTISANQGQAEPNTTTYFGAAGDCGMATATKVPGKQQFAFTLDHKAAYLLFLPHTSNNILNKCYLTRVEVNSDDDITDTYTLNPTTGELTGTGTGKQITLWIIGSGTYANGFPLTNSTASAATNGAYMVIKPGTHTLKIRYWVKDIVTNVEGTITKVLSSKNFEQNKYYNITANLDVRNYDGNQYYMWDAKENFWYGYEWNSATPQQPTENNITNSYYPKNSVSDPLRYYKESGYGTPAGRVDPTNSLFKSLPNVNEMIWYVKKGDPRWDYNELWTTMGHLYKGGVWIKKAAVIAKDYAFWATPATLKDAAPDGIDYRSNTPLSWTDADYSVMTRMTLPDASEAGNYFFLAPRGYYYGPEDGTTLEGSLSGCGYAGDYFSSSTRSWGRRLPFHLVFAQGQIGVTSNRPFDRGCVVQQQFE